jgi:endonuclease/exonuclease/phosphatase (EEP) superfamily protein YafD
MKPALEIFGSVMILFSFLPLIKSHYWWIRVLDFPRVQIAFFLTLTLIAYPVIFGVQTTPQIFFVLLLALALLNEMLHIYPFTWLSPVEALRSKVKAPKNSFSFMISNVRMSNHRYNKFLQVVKENDPDMLLVNEPDQKWAAALQELDNTYPYSIKKPLENTYGMMFYSKFELTETKINFLVEKDIPSFFIVIKLPSGKLFDMYTVHPQPPRVDKHTDTREAELLVVAKMAKTSPYPTIVAGDLNDVAWSHTTNLFKKISGLLDPRVGRGFYNTYNANIPFFRYSLDHIFSDAAFRLIRLKRLRGFGSDHFPMFIRLNYEPQEADEHEVPVAEQDDIEEAEELIEKGKENGS